MMNAREIILDDDEIPLNTKEIMVDNGYLMMDNNIIYYFHWRCANIIVDNIKNNRKLESIMLYKYNIAYLQHILNHNIAKYIKIRRLVLNSIDGFGDDQVKLLCSILKRNNTVTELELSNDNLTCNSALILSELLKHKLNIISLNVSNNNISNKGLYYLIRDIYHIKVLILDNNKIGTKPLFSLFPSMRISNFMNIQHITHLSLCNNNIDDKDAKVLCQNLYKSKISSLKLRFNKLTIKSLPNIANLLDNRNLTELDVSYNNFDYEGSCFVTEYSILVTAIASNNTLTNLYMDHCRISSQDINFFLTSLWCNKTLTKLTMESDIGYSGMQTSLITMYMNRNNMLLRKYQSTLIGRCYLMVKKYLNNRQIVKYVGFDPLINILLR
jgi:hypothetical protein